MTNHETDLIHAPWSAEQVTALNAFQHHGRMHPFTCGATHASGQSPVLVATHSGWVCPDPQCVYRQDWAHAFMAKPAALEPAVSVPPPATRADDRAAFVAEAEAKLTAGCPDHGPNGGWLMTCQCEAIGVLRDLADEAQGAAEYSRALATPPCVEAAAHIRERLADEATPVAAPSPPANEPGRAVAAPRADDQAALRDRIRRAVCEAEGFMWNTELLEPDEYGEVADAVLAVLPEPTELAALAVNAGRALRDEKRHYEIACEENARLRDTVERVRRLHDALDAETDLTSPDHEITRGAAARKIAAALDGWTDPAELRRLAAVSGPVAGEQQNETPEAEAPTTTKPETETETEKRLRYSEQRCEELRKESRRRGKTVLEYSEKIRALEREIDGLRRQLGAEILRANQIEAETAPVSPAYARLQAAAKNASEAAHLHAMHGMKRVFQLCRQYGSEASIPAAEVLDALGLDENANTVEPAAGVRQDGAQQ